jgi:Putative beta-barrel porin 2
MYVHPRSWRIVYRLGLGAMAGVLCFSGSAHAAYDYRDTLEKAFAGPDETELGNERMYDLFVADQYSYDSNVFRLPSSDNVSTLVGPDASRDDHINTASAGFEGQWTSGRQKINLDLRVDDNRYAQNSDLNNVSSNDKIVLDWGLGSSLSGQAGAYFIRSLASFINATTYTPNVADVTGFYGTLRYQFGPRWAVFGGVLGSKTTLSADASQANNNNNKIGDFGTEFDFSATDSVGLEYRYNDTTFPNDVVGGITVGDGNFREDTLRFILKYAISDKTSIDAFAGYMRRDYTNSAIQGFGGDTWRVSVRWQATDKTQIAADTWRRLQAYVSTQSQYFVSTGGTIGPSIQATDKLNFEFLAGIEQQKYIGSADTTATLDSAEAGITYKPLTSLTLNLTFRYQNRHSNDNFFQFDDNFASAGVTWRFL